MKPEERKDPWAGPKSPVSQEIPVPSPGQHCQQDSLTAPGWYDSAGMKFSLWILQENNPPQRILSINVIINLEKNALLNKMNL